MSSGFTVMDPVFPHHIVLPDIGGDETSGTSPVYSACVPQCPQCFHGENS